MNSEIQETIAEIRALIHLLNPILRRIENTLEDSRYAIAEMLALAQLMEPLLKKLEEHILVMERKNNGVD